MARFIDRGDVVYLNGKPFLVIKAQRKDGAVHIRYRRMLASERNDRRA